MRKQIANMLTASRILCSIGLLFCPVFSGSFYVLYLFCGLTDMVDGTVARKTGSAGEFGARLDTVADLAFAAAAFRKIIPQISLPKWLWCWVMAIAAVKTANYLWCFLVCRTFRHLHITANRITGFCLFCLPLTLPVLDLRYSAPAVCALATIAAIRELFLKRKVSQ